MVKILYYLIFSVLNLYFPKSNKNITEKNLDRVTDLLTIIFFLTKTITNKKLNWNYENLIEYFLKALGSNRAVQLNSPTFNLSKRYLYKS